MAELTYTELQTLVAEKLGIIADAESLSAEYASVIQKHCTSVQSQLELMDIASFVVEGGIDTAYSDAFADLVAAQCADPFQIQEPRRSYLNANRLGMPNRSPAERRMRDLFIGTKQYTKHDVTVV